MPFPDDFCSTGDTTLGWAFGCSRTGASHISTGRPCEDAYAISSGSAGAVPSLAIAVADGHGDPRHDQSRIGAGIAVQAALEELAAFHRMYLGLYPAQAFRAAFKNDFPRRLTRRWREMVDRDAEQRNSALAGNPGDQIYVRYGTTLIAALVVEDMILAGQIGDGDLILVRPDGSIEAPLPRDPGLVGSETHSLSSRDAHLLWRTVTLDRGEGGVIIAATDGISDSFEGPDSEEFFVFIQSIVDRVRTYGMENVARSVSQWLDRYSAIASGDDMTLVYACIHPAPAGEQKTTEADKQEPVLKPFEGW